MIVTTDQLGNKLTLKHFPKKIISLVPSQSELLWDLGLKEEIAGITKFCIHPDEMFHSKTRAGGTKKADIELIKKINPDLIIGNKEENTLEDISILQQNFPVWMSDVNSLEDAKNMIHELGRITNRKENAENILNKIGERIPHQTMPKVIYLIWKDPLMCVGTSTFINDMLNFAGFENCIKEERYPEISLEKISELSPDWLFLSTEPYPFKDAHKEYFNHSMSGQKTKIVDGEMFSWYGSRLIKAKAYFEKLRDELDQR